MTRLPAIGVIANPAAGRDVRRLMSWATPVSQAEKVHAVLRLLASAGALGLREAWLMPDASGLSARIADKARAARQAGETDLPEIRMLPLETRGEQGDSRAAAAMLRELGAGAIAVLGGDGTHRKVAQGCGQVPLLALSTGTNNAFPTLREPTLAGMALALYLRGAVAAELALQRNKQLRVRGPQGEAIALVDVVVSHQRALGARAVYEARQVHSVYAAFARPDAIGLSSIAAYAHPVTRSQPWGCHVRLGDGRALQVPLMPGVVQRVGVLQATRLLPGQAHALPALAATLAFDGEREWVLDPRQPCSIELELDGPRTVGVEAILAHAAQHGLLYG